MKRFSNITNQNVGEQPKNEMSKEEVEYMNLKASIQKLLDSCLSVKIIGNVRQFIPTLRIEGKDLFCDTLISLMNDKSLKDQVKVLESLKSETKDWLTVDNKIDEIFEKINDNKVEDNLLNHIEKVKSFISIYGDDNNFEKSLNENVNKISDADIAYNRSIAAEKMINNVKYFEYSKEKLKKMSEKYYERYNELKNKPE